VGVVSPSSPSGERVGVRGLRHLNQPAPSIMSHFNLTHHSEGLTLSGSGSNLKYRQFFSMHWLIEFIFPRRLHRIAYLLRGLLAGGAAYTIYGISGGMMNSPYFLGAIIALNIYDLFFIELPRARDLEISGWWLLFLFVPGPNIVLWLILLLRAPVFLHLQGEPIRGGEQPVGLSSVALNQV
jgi:hypothetical protein